MRIAVFTREYPPDVYGGAGVHVDFLVRELRQRMLPRAARIAPVSVATSTSTSGASRAAG